MNPRLQFMLDIIRKIGDFQHSHFRTEIKFDDKNQEIGSTVSFVDNESERMFHEALAQEFPGEVIFGEETFDATYDYKKHDKIWIIDPLDGTLLYKRGISNYGPMIAYVENGIIKCSAIFLPESSELYHADNSGSYKNNQKISISSTENLSVSLTTMANWGLNKLTQNDTKIAQIIKHLNYTIEFYSCASNFSLCASGATDGGFFYSKYGNIWDTVPGGFLIQQAGGKVTNFGSDTWDIFNPKVIFSNGHIHAEFQKLLEL